MASFSHQLLQLFFGPGVDAINSISPDKSDEDDQECMDCKKDNPVLEMEPIVFLDNGITFKYSQTRRRYDKGPIVMVNLNRKMNKKKRLKI